MGAFTGTFDNSVNNNNITVSNSGNAINLSGSGTRTINLGTATYTLTNATCTFTVAVTTNLTLSSSNATITFTSTASGNRTITTGASRTFGTVNCAAGAAGANARYSIGAGGAGLTIGTLNVNAPSNVFLTDGPLTISSAISCTGSSSAQIGLQTDTAGFALTLNLPGSSTLAWCSIRDVAFTGSPTATNSFDLGNVSGISISAPTGGAAPARVIGG